MNIHRFYKISSQTRHLAMIFALSLTYIILPKKMYGETNTSSTQYTLSRFSPELEVDNQLGYDKAALFPQLDTDKNVFRSSYLAKDSILETASNVKPTIWQKIAGGVSKVIDKWNAIDTTYIEPQHYNFTVMLQNTNSYEVYKLKNANKQSITFAPDNHFRIGPFLGWRWVFLGYTLDIKHLNFKRGKSQRQEYDLCLYSSLVGLDLYYRKTGNDYKIRNLYIDDYTNTSSINGADFSGIKSTIKGFNLYYILNHKRFSYPAAFSQSTIQRRSAGSPLIGFAYTRHTLSVNWNALNELITNHFANQSISIPIDSTAIQSTIKYTDIAFSGGYAYNWVFARNWLMATSLSLGLSYKRTKGDLEREEIAARDFSLRNFNLDAVGRYGIIWNNTRWYAGMSAIMHAYNYRRKEFSTNNIFGNINFYVGYNFGKRKNK